MEVENFQKKLALKMFLKTVTIIQGQYLMVTLNGIREFTLQVDRNLELDGM